MAMTEDELDSLLLDVDDGENHFSQSKKSLDAVKAILWEFKSLKNQLATVTAERDALAEEVQRRRLEVDALENETGLHEERRQFNARIAQLEAELAQARQEAELLREYNISVSAEWTRMQQQLHAAQARAERLVKGWNIMQSALCSIATPALGGKTQQWKAQEVIRQINALEETEEAP